MGISNIFKYLWGKGFKISYSTGKTFDPRNQTRSDALEDIAKKKEERNGNKDKFK